MTLFINPGSGPIADSGEGGWTNTVEHARLAAHRWLRILRREGFHDVEIVGERDAGDGRWVFRFRHAITGVTVDLDTHGIDDMDAYLKERIFSPRTYWNGGSSSDPCLEDWAAPGFEPVQTWRPVARPEVA